MTAMAASAPLWSPPARPAPVAEPPAPAVTVNPNHVTAALLVSIVAIVAFHQPIREAIGTAHRPATTIALPDLPPLVELGPRIDMPRVVPPARSPALHAPRDPFKPFPDSQGRAGRHESKPPASPTRGYTVRAGDSLWSIASRELDRGASTAAIGREWQRLYAANEDRIGADPASLRIGLTLDLAALQR